MLLNLAKFITNSMAAFETYDFQKCINSESYEGIFGYAFENDFLTQQMKSAISN